MSPQKFYVLILYVGFVICNYCYKNTTKRVSPVHKAVIEQLNFYVILTVNLQLSCSKNKTQHVFSKT